MPGASLRIEHLTKRFGAVAAVDDVSFEVAAGQFVVLLGPSGSGKTTILRMVAGLEAPTSGRIWFGDQDTTRTPAHKRGIGYVFQRPSMFPHYTVRENIGWGLKLRKMPRAEIEQRVTAMIDLVQLHGLDDRYATQLSGGQAQRVVIARALAPDPPILLLDEPLSALDAKLRDELKDVIADVQRRTRKTMMMVTHDQREALSLADSVVVMDLGRIAQLGSPADVYRHPATAFVASFVGNTNLVPGTVATVLANRRMTVRALGQEIAFQSVDGFLDQPGTVIRGNHDRCQVTLLAHTCPAYIYQAFALALAVSLDILAIGAVDDRSLAATDKTDDFIARQRIATVGQAGHQATDTRHLQVS